MFPTDRAWGHAGYPAEVPGQVALVGEPRRQCDRRHGKIRIAEHFPGVFDAAAQYVAVRGHTNCLLECAREVVCGQPGHFRERFEAYVLTEIGVDVFADAVGTRRR